MMEMQFKNYYRGWLSGLASEIEFWDTYIRTKGASNEQTEDAFHEEIRYDKKFTFEKELSKYNNGNKIYFADVGSGPFSGLGSQTDGFDLEINAIDPLAFIYDKMKWKYGMESELILKTGFVEFLDKYISANTYDIVHMSNALDHSFDPVTGIKQLLSICKIGGEVILRHTENVAEEGNYSGLHQWNLSLHNQENSFIVWRGEQRWDICKLLAEYADIELYPDCVEPETGWVYNKVVLIKKKDIPKQKDEYYEDAMLELYHFLLEYIYKGIILYDYTNESRSKKLDLIDAISNDRIKNKLADKNILIYGYSLVGKKLYRKLKDNNINVKAVIDRAEKNTEEEQRIIKPAELLDIDKQDYIIITLNSGTENIVEFLLEKSMQRENILTIEDLLMELD